MFLKGVVEDVDDPLKLGRVRVRVVGKHCGSKAVGDFEHMPISDLPWAVPIFANGSAISGVSNFSVPEINSVVACGYFDVDEQELFYLGSLGLLGTTKIDGFGVSSNANPNKENPISDLALGTNDIPEISKTSTITGAVPTSGYAAVYPNNKVIETKSGHVIELDDTDGAERIRIYHKSGSFYSINQDGDTVDYASGDKYLVCNSLNIWCSVSVKVHGNLISDGNIEDFKGTMDEMRTVFNNHTHTFSDKILDGISSLPNTVSITATPMD